MRVSSTHYPEALGSHLQRIAQRQLRIQNQLATGQTIQQADENPLLMQEALRLQDQSRAIEQYENNAQTHKEFASATFGVLRSLQRVSDRAQEIATAVDSLKSPEELKSYAVEVAQLIQQALQAANSKFKDSFLLGGTKNSAPPFAANTDASGKVTSVSFSGNASSPQSEIAPGVLISSSVPGENTSGAGERGVLRDSRSGADMFAHLVALHEQLVSGDVQSITQTTRTNLKADEENLLFHIANNGALQSRLETSIQSSRDQSLANDQELARRNGVDIAEVTVRLQQTQLNYQAALQGAASILDLSILDFLR